jgi:hypothetical protein
MKLTLFKCDCCKGAIGEMVSECGRVVSSMCVRAQGGVQNTGSCFKSGWGGMIRLAKFRDLELSGKMDTKRHPFFSGAPGKAHA